MCRCFAGNCNRKMKAKQEQIKETAFEEEQYVGDGTNEPAPLLPHAAYRDAETLTDVCNSTELPEVEIISLLEEKLPVYKLRADSVYGYEHDDWLHTPLISPDTHIDLTAEQIEETLNYFLLCAERVGQMTKTYNDIDAVTRLLEEKERDLELAARIGQSLLKKNRSLSEQNEYLEEQVGNIREEVAQLHHELNLKDELLQFYTNTAEESEDDAKSPSGRRTGAALSFTAGSSVDVLQRKLRDLEEENLSLRSEASNLKSETETFEEKEQQLVNDCVKELRQSSLQISTIAEELTRKTEDAARQQEEITYLLSQIVDLQKKAKTYALENEELSQHLVAAKDAQRQLTAELQELGEKYLECIEMLHEAQEELKNLRNRSVTAGTLRRYHPLGLFPMDSLAAEIEGSMRMELSHEQPEHEEQKVRQKRVFETVKNVNQSVRQRSPVPPSTNIPGSNQTHSSLNSTLSDGNTDNISALDNREQTLLLEAESTDANSNSPEKRSSSEDLKLALRRLSLRRQNCLSERRFFEGARERRHHDTSLHGIVSGESIMSLGVWASRPYLPDKLQIVKPLEGSATLQQWQQLAQPNLGGILDARPGVVPKGFRPLELDLEEVYHYSDYEEDEPGEQYFQNLPTTTMANPGLGHASSASPSPCLSTGHASADFSVYYPGKCMAHTSSTYTFTTCKILHPSDEVTRVTPSLNPAPTSSCPISSSLRSTPAVTPCTPRRLSLSQSQSFTNLRDSTKTFSTSLGLVRLLQERGISAAVYQPRSWDRVSEGVLLSTSILPPSSPPDYQKPSTPPNSPARHTPSPHTVDPDNPADFSFKSPSYENFLASKPARSILKEMAGGAQARDCESQTDVSVYNLNLVDKLKRLGLASPGASGISGPHPMLGPLGGLRRTGSPFTPLNEGLRRNRSYPAVVGASMAMKGPGPQDDEMILASKLPKQTSLK
ncbi:Trafficking kinesin-binding protein 1 [Bagarius yarrelli]|uniref:Trafficking kinesin-binding protein 1 n=1 Tax=Bagarius yarrelli TaxID=175774 RepID=A0A556TVJ4_BAGYA|nr:Trafficking kinesin-binding protein 1 [Bagarius yarrelli]